VTSDRGSILLRRDCNFTENGDDSFAIQGNFGKDGGAVKVIGASGRFEGANGDGTITSSRGAERPGPVPLRVRHHDAVILRRTT